ncbi:hypothetical protein NG796_21740 [Laspinema sp. A4]|uniref:hypothetical protein n=1 Tax=Laspinema sp. D2d TaxID=2953686 RepID=UPI0021BB1B1A|nr:hypothetical protein [Laspinema sp. D2d]MCT7985903.1 hypothetical protein [Laspinema sp. D2d]
MRILSNSIGKDAIEVEIVSKGDRASCEVGDKEAIAQEEPHPNPPLAKGRGPEV